MINPDNGFSYVSYRDFCRTVKKISHPSGVPESRSTAYDNYLVNALITAQKFVDCLRSVQVSFYFKNSAFDQCGMSTLVGPRGKINAIYAFKPGDPCNKHFYVGRTTQFLSCWARANSCRWATNPSMQAYTLASELCYPYYDSGTPEDDSEFVNCDEKFFARDNAGQLYLAPRFPCGYAIAIHWEGLRRKWNPLDPIVDDPDLIDWVAAQVQSEMKLRHDEDAVVAAQVRALAQGKFADLMYWCNEERIAQAKIDCVRGLDANSLENIFQPVYDLPGEDIAARPPVVIYPSLCSGLGSPEGFVVAIPGSIYTDELTGQIYLKLSGEGSTGWR